MNNGYVLFDRVYDESIICYLPGMALGTKLRSIRINSKFFFFKSELMYQWIFFKLIKFQSFQIAEYTTGNT